MGEIWPVKLRYTQQAAAEVDALLAYIAGRSTQGAHRVGACIKRAERILINHPEVGQLTSARLPAVRRLVLNPYPYVLFYEIEDTVIKVIGVRHAARDPSSMPDQP